MPKARVGFIGAGVFISAHHLLAVRDSEIMELRAIADLNEDILKKHDQNFEVGYTTTDYKELLEDPEVDIVIIGTKQDLHARLIVESLDAGKWVLCEKPMASNEEETQEVLLAEKRSRGRLAIGFNRRFAPAYVDTKRLMREVKRPWFINYRLMSPNPDKRSGYYAKRPKILYEGCHILHLVCWLLDSVPRRVFMTGDRYLNNCCILDYSDGSQVAFMCGSMGSSSLWKEYMEVFGEWAAITVSDFVDMRVRGVDGQFDRVFPPQLGEHAEEIKKWGFDFYDMYRGARIYERRRVYKEAYGMDIGPVRRSASLPFDVSRYGPVNPDLYDFIPNKGWIESVEHFARCFLDGIEPKNAGGASGALSTQLALALLESLDSGRSVDFNSENKHGFS